MNFVIFIPFGSVFATLEVLPPLDKSLKNALAVVEGLSETMTLADPFPLTPNKPE
jgi:hypothetical protein